MSTSAPDANDGPPASFAIAPEVAAFDVPVRAYLDANPTIAALVTGAAVFFDGGRRKILLVQRSAVDYVPLKWEMPGGTCEPGTGETVLQALARELWEETGLRLRAVTGLVDGDMEFETTGRTPRRWRKLTFEVEVDGHRGSGAVDVDPPPGEAHGFTVRLDPAEHQDYVWASEEDVVRGRCRDVALEITFPQQRDIVLKAFSIGRDGQAG